MSILQINRM